MGQPVRSASWRPGIPRRFRRRQHSGPHDTHRRHQRHRARASRDGAVETPALGGGRRKWLPGRAKLQDDHAMNTPVVPRVGRLIDARLLSLVRE